MPNPNTESEILKEEGVTPLQARSNRSRNTLVVFLAVVFALAAVTWLATGFDTNETNPVPAAVPGESN
ncbi:hypothetical protein DFR52_101765 [Hoeflea marina]|uniref:Uncharacterized protein n=1 Tax=Hoeflea marina TaxID=274592 RepID=A0A317PTP0_9HYPH|nr:hypothetical protein [Hoeflea marina]PWW04075.1 hypothetical protein DFR52_101765 [Hoeflea marina]